MDDSLYILFTWSRFNPLSLTALPSAKVSALFLLYFITVLPENQAKGNLEVISDSEILLKHKAAS